MRKTFHRELDELNNNLIEMGKMCEEVIEAAVKVLLPNKVEKLKNVIKIRDQIDKSAYSIEDSCMKMLVRQQPLARDMNQIATSLKLIRDMERIGTQAVELAAIAKDIKPNQIQCSDYLSLMTDQEIQMLKDTIYSFIKMDKIKAKEVIKNDDKLDKYYLIIKEKLSDLIFENKNETSVAIDILMVAKYLERIGDHTVNIARWIIELENNEETNLYT